MGSVACYYMRQQYIKVTWNVLKDVKGGTLRDVLELRKKIM